VTPPSEAKVAEAHRLHFDEGYTYREIAAELGANEISVRSWFAPERVLADSPVFVHRSSNQRDAALKAAQRVRSRRAQIKRDLAAGRITLRELIAKPPVILRTTRVEEILRAAPQIGPSRARSIMLRARLSENAVFSWMRPGPTKRLLAELPDRDPDRAQRLKAQRMTNAQIGAALNVSHETARKLVTA
jgi:hypothetical protein